MFDYKCDIQSPEYQRQKEFEQRELELWVEYQMMLDTPALFDIILEQVEERRCVHHNIEDYPPEAELNFD